MASQVETKPFCATRTYTVVSQLVKKKNWTCPYLTLYKLGAYEKRTSIKCYLNKKKINRSRCNHFTLKMP